MKLAYQEFIIKIAHKGQPFFTIFRTPISTCAPPAMLVRLAPRPIRVSLTFIYLCIKLNKIEMDFKYTKHALISLQERHIEKNLVEETVSSPDQVFKRKGDKKVAQKLYKRLDRDFLLRVIYNQKENLIIVITAYWTSKINKYLEEKNESKI